MSMHLFRGETAPERCQYNTQSESPAGAGLSGVRGRVQAYAVSAFFIFFIAATSESSVM